MKKGTATKAQVKKERSPKKVEKKNFYPPLR
jgi:hypothetical protein